MTVRFADARDRAQAHGSALSQRRWFLAASAGVLVVGVIVGWKSQASEARQAQVAVNAGSTIEASLRAHSLFAGGKSILTEFPPDKVEDFREHCRRLLGLRLDVTGLGQIRYDFVGGRLLPMLRTAAAVLMFRSDGRIISVFGFKDEGHLQLASVQRPVGEPSFKVLHRTGFSVLIVGDIDPMIRDSLANLIGRVREE